MAGKTVAYPTISLGLNANPLKKGLAEARGAVAQGVEGIKQSAASLVKTRFTTAFAEKIRPSDYNLKATVKDLATHYGSEIKARFGELKTKFSESQSGKDLIADFGAFWNKISEIGAKARSSGIGRGLEWFGSGTVKNAGRFAAGSGISALASASGAALMPALKLGAGGLGSALWSGLKIGGGTLGSGVSMLANLPGTLSKMALPLNQTLELAGKANRLLGAPIRAAMGAEAVGNQAVWEGGRSALNDSGWSGTLARFTSSFDGMLTSWLNAADKIFGIRGWIEAGRGVTDSISRMLDAAVSAFGFSGEQDLNAMFTAGQDVAIELAQQGVDFLADIYNTMLDVTENVMKLVAFAAHPFSYDAMLKEWHTLMEGSGLRDRQGNKLGRIDKDQINAFFQDVKDGINFDRMISEMLGEKPGQMEVDAKARADANKSLKDMTRSITGANDAIYQANLVFDQAKEQIRLLANAGGSEAQVKAATAAIERQRDLSILDSLKPIMDAAATNNTSQAFEMNSAALVESVMKAQQGSGGDDIQGRILAAAEAQANMVKIQKDIQEQQLQAIRQLPRNPVGFVGPIPAGG